MTINNDEQEQELEELNGILFKTDLSDELRSKLSRRKIEIDDLIAIHQRTLKKLLNENEGRKTRSNKHHKKKQNERELIENLEEKHNLLFNFFVKNQSIDFDKYSLKWFFDYELPDGYLDSW